MVNGKTGYLVNNVKQCADRVAYLLQNPRKAAAIGKAGKEHVRRNFLVTRHLLDYICMFKRTLKNANGMKGRVSSIPKGMNSRMRKRISSLSDTLVEISKG